MPQRPCSCPGLAKTEDGVALGTNSLDSVLRRHD